VQADQISPVATTSSVNSISTNLTRSVAMAESTPLITNNKETTTEASRANKSNSNSTPQTSTEKMQSTKNSYKNYDLFSSAVLDLVSEEQDSRIFSYKWNNTVYFFTIKIILFRENILNLFCCLVGVPTRLRTGDLVH
jgi:hypothetical protein